MPASEPNVKVVDLLDAVLDHLAEHDLPEPYGVQAQAHAAGDTAQVNIHLVELTLLPAARGLKAWADTLDGATLSVWRPPSSDAVHIQVAGRLPGGVPIEVWAAITDSALPARLEPGQRRALDLILLRAWIVILTAHERTANQQAGGDA